MVRAEGVSVPGAILAVSGLEKTSAAFRRRLLEVSAARGLNADYLAAVMSFETGGLFFPGPYPSSGAVGLIQFTPVAAQSIGKSMSELASMSAVRQLIEVGRYFDKIGKPVSSLEDHALAVFAPAFIGQPPGTVVYATPSAQYEKNKGLDLDNSGTITVAEYVDRVKRVYDEAQARPRLPVADAFVDSFGDSLLLPGIVAVIAALHFHRRAA